MKTARLFDLPYGTRFRYVGKPRVYVFLGHEGSGLIADYMPFSPGQRRALQGAYSASETRAKFERLEVEVVEHVEPLAVAPAEIAQRHTAEPWRAGSGPGGNGSIVADEPVHDMNGSDAVDYYGGHLIAESMVQRNIRRAVACVNACRGVPTEVLEVNAAGGLPWNVGDQIEQRVQRDQLAETLRFAIRFFDQLTPSDAERMRKVLEKVAPTASLTT